MKQITTRLYLANTISDEQLDRLSPNLVVVLDSGNNESKYATFCMRKGFISKIHDVTPPFEAEVEKYAKMSDFVFATGDKILVLSNSSRSMHMYAEKLISCVTGMHPQDAAEFVRNKIAKN